MFDYLVLGIVCLVLTVVLYVILTIGGPTGSKQAIALRALIFFMLTCLSVAMAALANQNFWSHALPCVQITLYTIGFVINLNLLTML